VSPLAPLLIGAALCFAGAWSIRLSVLLAGFGAGWVLGEAFGASAGTALLIGVSAAVVLGVLALLMTKVLFLIAGGCVGAVIGARLFVVLRADASIGHGDWLIGFVFVAAIAMLSGFLASHLHRRFLVWGTAIAGGSLVLGGIGRLLSGADQLWRPDTAVGTAAFVASWIVLTLLGHEVQNRAVGHRKDDESGQAGQRGRKS